MNWSANKGPTAAELEFQVRMAANLFQYSLSSLLHLWQCRRNLLRVNIGFCILRFPICCPGYRIPSQDSDDGCQQLTKNLSNEFLIQVERSEIYHYYYFSFFLNPR